ncbi:MAG: site-specific DNA-methyltransferase [Pirellulales bacterium]|nr:site-specific DNA-methyltransferase [Pirellulales bacterium]
MRKSCLCLPDSRRESVSWRIPVSLANWAWVSPSFRRSFKVSHAIDACKRHYATFPDRLVTPIILACSKPGDLVLDPFAGSGTTCRIAAALGRRFLGIELNPEYARMARATLRVSKRVPPARS